MKSSGPVSTTGTSTEQVQRRKAATALRVRCPQWSTPQPQAGKPIFSVQVSDFLDPSHKIACVRASTPKKFSSHDVANLNSSFLLFILKGAED